VSNYVDFQDNGSVPPPGGASTTRIARVNGQLQMSADGSGFGNLGTFGEDTIVDKPNANGALVAALELLTTLPVTTAGAESAAWAIKLLVAGAQLALLTLDGSAQAGGRVTGPVGVTAGSGRPGIGVGDGLVGIAQNSNTDLCLITHGGNVHVIGNTAVLLDSGSANGAGFFITNDQGNGVVFRSGVTGVALRGGAADKVTVNATGVSFQNVTTPIAKPTVTGSKGANAALTSLMTALANYGLVTDSTT